MKNVKIVIGSNAGDESKGLVVNAFTKQMVADTMEKPIIIFHNGTAQRGHTVDYTNSLRHVYHHFGSGTMSNGRTFFSQSFLVHPMEYAREYKELVNQFHMPPDRTYCSPYCKVITPFDMLVDRATEEWITLTTGAPEHASCAFGSWCAVEDRLPMGTTPYHIWEFCTCEEEEYQMMMRNVWADCVKVLDKRGVDLMQTSYKDYAKATKRNQVAARFYEDIKFFRAHNEFIPFNELWERSNNFIFEGGQGLALDMNVSNEWHTTSLTGLENPIQMLFKKKDFSAEVCYVSRSYATRHGIGPMDDEAAKKEINADMIDKTNVRNDYQGELRYGYLSDEGMKKRIEADFAKTGGDKRFTKAMVITHCNEFPDEKQESKYYSDNPFGMEERK